MAQNGGPQPSAGGYPASLRIDYPEQSDRLSVFFRLFLAIPVLVVLLLLVGAGTQDSSDDVRYIGTAGFVVVPTVLMILVRRKYPRWWFDWNVALTKFSARVLSYVLFLRDEYPSTDEEQAVHIDIAYPDVERDLSRWMPLVKWLLVLPHVVVLSVLWAAVVIVWIIAWFAIVFTGRYPQGLFDFVVGVMRWSLRVDAYSLLLTTDEYPPFSLQA
jgi:hypothetical protein